MEMHEEFEQLMAQVSKGLENAADDIAEASWALFQAYQEAGFTEEQAMELLKNDPVEATAQ